ncbi:MAG: TssQ family T6SS-associated lipoprotein [Usitatibacter sp.]
MRFLPLPRFALLAALLLAGACAEMQRAPEKPAPVTPQITEEVLRERAREQLAQGIRQYEAGDFENAMKSLTLSLDHGVLSKAEQSNARKYLAFTHCVSNREAQCRDEFRKAFEINSDFSLSAAEDGHPIWGPVYRNVRTQLIAEREAVVRKPIIPLSKSEQMLSDGLVKYDSGDYDGAQKLLEGALKEGLPEVKDQVRAMKRLAFALCLQNRVTQCRGTFAKIFEIDPAFDLTPAEVGHPSWGKTFSAAKKAHEAKLAKEAQEKAAKEAKEKAAREKAAAPGASPKKN